VSAEGRVLMVQGTASSVGKSLIVAALCRIFYQDGLRVAPFKAQNMSNNAAVTPEGGEIGRAQAVQAAAARIAPTVDMNPILLKPEGNRRSQVVIRGHAAFTLHSSEFLTRKLDFWPEVTASLDRLRAAYDLIVIEGAGSPAEINLRAGDIVNMRVARYANAPVTLVGDIDRGGVFAHLYGTVALLEPEERALIQGFIINRFRGDLALLEPGLRMIEARAGIPVLGVVPYVTDLGIAEEDAVALERRGPARPGALDIAVIQLPRIANFDDLDSLEQEADASVRYITAANELGSPDLVIIPGTKTTIPDLLWLHERGIAAAIEAHASRGGAVFGLCGGYQMLGREVRDPFGIESETTVARGLGLLPLATELAGEKATHLVAGRVVYDAGLLAGAGGAPVTGYEIHMGETIGECSPLLRITSRSGEGRDLADGAVAAEGMVLGTYVHGLLANDLLRQRLLANLAARRGVSYTPSAVVSRDAALDRWAAVVRASLDIAALSRMAAR